jgi:two-component system cell cycle response regulator DivK
MAESILVVDDNLDNRELTQILLECEGFEVRLAEDAAQALRMFETYRPKLLLVDVQMPGMDGLELTRRLRRDPSSQDAIVVALSAYAMAAEKANALAAGCDGYITKPINTRTFASAVRRYLEVPARPPRMEQASAA